MTESALDDYVCRIKRVSSLSFTIPLTHVAQYDLVEVRHCYRCGEWRLTQSGDEQQ